MPGNWAYEFSGKKERRKPLATNSRAVVELVDGCRTSQNLQKDQRITPHRVTAIQCFTVRFVASAFAWYYQKQRSIYLLVNKTLCFRLTS